MAPPRHRLFGRPIFNTFCAGKLLEFQVAHFHSAVRMELLFWAALALALVSSEVQGFSSILFGRKLLTKSLDFVSSISTIVTPVQHQYQYASSASLRMVADTGSVETDENVGNEDAVDEEDEDKEVEETQTEARHEQT